jgi:hypothetical protein
LKGLGLVIINISLVGIYGCYDKCLRLDMNRTLCTSLHKHSQTRMVPAKEHLPSPQREWVSNLSLLMYCLFYLIICSFVRVLLASVLSVLFNYLFFCPCSGITLIGYVQVKRMKSKTILNFENFCEPDRIANTCKGSYAWTWESNVT